MFYTIAVYVISLKNTRMLLKCVCVCWGGGGHGDGGVVLISNFIPV